MEKSKKQTKKSAEKEIREHQKPEFLEKFILVDTSVDKFGNVVNHYQLKPKPKQFTSTDLTANLKKQGLI